MVPCLYFRLLWTDDMPVEVRDGRWQRVVSSPSGTVHEPYGVLARAVVSPDDICASIVVEITFANSIDKSEESDR